MKMLREWPVYRFELPYVKVGRWLSKCMVEIYAEGCKPYHGRPVVVVTDLPEYLGVCNDIEVVCSTLRREFLSPLRMPVDSTVWLLCHNRGTDDEEWSEVTFAGFDQDTGEYQNPDFDEGQAVEFDWDSLIADKHYRTERHIIEPTRFHEENFQFTPDECYRMRTGRCSLDEDAVPESHPGECGYEWCRGLAVYAQVWQLAASFYGGDIPSEETVLEDMPLWRFIQEHFSDRHGRLPRQRRRCVEKAVKLFGGTDISQGIHGGYDDDGQVGLNDGCHRSCVAQRLGIRVAAFMEVPASR